MMKRKNATRSALVTSILALLVCVSMLVGATFAWFTDNVVSGRNVIAAGNLDVELVNEDGPVTGNTVLFDDVNPDLWEPGAVAYENLQVKNVGTLALKYNLELTVLNETVVGEHKLSDVIKVGIVEGGITSDDRNVVIGQVDTWTNLSDFSLDMNGKELAAKTDDDEFGIVLYWQPNSNEIDNLYNMNNGSTDVLKLDIGVNLYATQVEAEFDSFGNDYDAGLNPEAIYVTTAAQLQDALKKGGKVVLQNDIALDASAEFMATNGNGSLLYLDHVDVTLDLNGHDIVAEADAVMIEGKAPNALILVRYSTLNIVGEGNLITKNKSMPLYGWAHSEINIYGGTFKGNAYERNESDVYVNNDTVTINVYGGNFADSGYAFNAHDSSANAPVIILHEGVTYKDFLKNGTTNVIANDINNGRIVLAEGTYLKTYENNGETWHQVAKKQEEGTVYLSSVDDMREAMKNPNAKIVLTDDLIIDDDKGTGYALYAKYDMEIDLNGHDIKVNMPGKEFYGVIYALNGAKVNIVGQGGVEVNGGVGPFVWITGGADTGSGKEADGTTINIYGGNWTQNSPNFSNESYCEGIYANRGGIINIYGGMFDWGTFSKYTVNESREGVINIYGGTFVNFDPRVSHDTDGSYVAEGYTVVSETQTNGDVWYTVVPEA